MCLAPFRFIGGSWGGNSSLYNAPAAFLHHLEIFGPDGVRLRSALSGGGKRQRPRVAKKMNRTSSDALDDLMKSFESYGKVGPQGSYSRDCVLNEEEIRERIWCEDLELAKNWGEVNLDRWKDAFDLKVFEYVHTDSERRR